MQKLEIPSHHLKHSVSVNTLKRRGRGEIMKYTGGLKEGDLKGLKGGKSKRL